MSTVGERSQETPGTLADESVARDQARFVGRELELESLARALADEGSPPIVVLHGPPGIGKSALTRELARRMSVSGWRVRSVDPSAAIDESFLGWEGARPLVVCDPLPADAKSARVFLETATTLLPAGSRMLATSRKPLGLAGGNWDGLVNHVSVGPMTPDDAIRLMGNLGVAERYVSQLGRWGDGEPLALILGARHLARYPDADLAGDPRLAKDVLERCGEDELFDVDERVLKVASVVPRLDEKLAIALLADTEAGSELDRLARTSVAHRSGRQVFLEPRVRQALVAVQSAQDPFGDRALRRRVADALHERVVSGDAPWLAVMADLFRDARTRWAFAADERHRYLVGGVRPGDDQAVCEMLGAAKAEWWPGLRRWFVEAPGCVTTVRDRQDRLAGFCVLMTPASAPSWAASDEIVGPRLRHALRRYPAGDVVIWRDTFSFPHSVFDDPAGPFVLAMHGAINRSGSIEASCTYGSVVAGDELAHAIADAYGASPLPELEVVNGGRKVECHILHHGFGSFAGGARALVYRDVGLLPPPPGLESIGVAVRSALRTFHDDVVLASNPLASGATAHDRAESVRDVIRQAIRDGFGESPDLQLAAKAIETGYLTAGVTHETAARSLHLARSTYFRHLGVGMERITVTIHDRIRSGGEASDERVDPGR
jgi:hypothetical protein